MAMHTIIATFEIVTPMFLGDANQNATRIRESSIKGALAFWWRALNYARYVKNDDHSQALKEMQKEEQLLFGGPKGQGAFLLRVVPSNLKTWPEEISKKNTKLYEDKNKDNLVGPGARYLGYGLIGAVGAKAAMLEDRSCFQEKQTFSVEFIFKSKGSIPSILQALKLFGLFGGLGSRVRRGWGSVALISIVLPKQDKTLWKGPTNKTEYLEEIKNLLNEIGNFPSGTTFPLTAFSHQSRIWVGNKRCHHSRGNEGNLETSQSTAVWQNPLVALDWLGRAFLNYRSWGQSGFVGTESDVKQRVQKQFKADHNWFYNTDDEQSIVPQRSVFGIPHNYFKYFKDNKDWKGSVTSNCGSKVLDRRASPMFFHIHKIENNYIAVVSLFPTKFLPGKIVARRSTGATTYSGAQRDGDADLMDQYGQNSATGLDVLLDFVGHGPGHFTPNQVLSFEQILP
ncbi:type III-B CRISPR module RAMP protein Cmr1 [uncultured Cohaesibacter sp.]|uniref:type III-B CRISPR module RAMP protein Cmr1 n=1 Tax=uncultured Cohaesibacter sp. TaxID=1002546 RepID=UPI002AA83057|nr:type III-B CRISPR module RAMP protein Cmr1 [uncultured Cohaesibacter sp.]